MKFIQKLALAILPVVAILAACTSGSQSEKSKMLVCYFSATGTTAQAAQRIADILGADIYEITPVELYTDADLNYRDSLSRSFVEMHDKTSRPAIVDSLPDMTQYDVVFIGYPNWWNTAPTVVNTFIEAVDLEGRTIVPFMTSGTCDIENSENDLHQTYPELNFAKGLLMNSVSDDQIQEWVTAVQAKK